jgi:hypothetical protein
MSLSEKKTLLFHLHKQHIFLMRYLDLQLNISFTNNYTNIRIIRMIRIVINKYHTNKTNTNIISLRPLSVIPSQDGIHLYKILDCHGSTLAMTE